MRSNPIIAGNEYLLIITLYYKKGINKYPENIPSICVPLKTKEMLHFHRSNMFIY